VLYAREVWVTAFRIIRDAELLQATTSLRGRGPKVITRGFALKSGAITELPVKISTRPDEARDQSDPNRITICPENDGDPAGGLLRGKSAGVTPLTPLRSHAGV
jgi:hypothetical protein